MADTSAKKRKRPAGQHGEAKKKVAIEQPASLPHSVSVSSVVRPRFSPPVIATTPGLVLSRDVRFRSYAKPEPAPSKKRKQSSQTPPQPPKDILLHSSSHRTLDYTAHEDKPKGMESLLKHYICVFDPALGSLKIVEARKMVVRGVVRSRMAADEAMAERTVRENLTDMKNELGQAFGTKKAKKAIVAMAENALTPRKGPDGEPLKLGDEDLALMDSIKESTANMATREELQAAVDQARPVPKGNYEAADIQDVYDPKEIIGGEILNAIPIRDWQEKAKKQEEIQVPSRFVANRINRVAANEHAAQRLKMLRYMLFLLIFWVSTTSGKGHGAKRIAKREKLRELLAPAPEAVIENIRRKFSDNGEMRKIHIDLLMTHCCVFASIIDSFDVNTFDLREDLRIDQKQINQYFHEIGARTRQTRKDDKTENLARLALPLQFPRLRQQRQGR